MKKVLYYSMWLNAIMASLFLVTHFYVCWNYLYISLLFSFTIFITVFCLVFLFSLLFIITREHGELLNSLATASKLQLALTNSALLLFAIPSYFTLVDIFAFSINVMPKVQDKIMVWLTFFPGMDR